MTYLRNGFLLAALCAAATVAAEDKGPSDQKIRTVAHTTAAKPAVYRLRYRFVKGEEVHYEVKHDSTIEMQKGPAKDKALNSSVSRKHLKVVSVDADGNAELEPVIDSVKMWVQFNDGKKLSFDSETDEKPLRQFLAVAQTIGKPLVRIKVGPDGRLISATPILDKKLQGKVTVPQGPPRASSDPSKNFLVVFPEKPIRIGETWTNSDLKVNLLVQKPRLWQQCTILRKYKLVSVEEGKATISLATVTSRPVNAPSLKAQLVQRLQSGTIVFDIVSGRIVSRHMTADNKVLGIVKGQSMLHVQSDRREKLIDDVKVAGKPKARD